MADGYDQFFKKVRKAASQQRPQQSSNDMAESLREKVKPRIEKAKKSRGKIPWKLVGVSFVGLIVAIAGLIFFDDIEKVVKNIEIKLMGEAVAEETSKKPKTEGDKGAKDGKDAAKKSEEKTTTVAEGNKEFTSEELNHFYRLNDRKRELDSREEELNRTESELNAQKQELDKKLQELETTRQNISSVLEDRVNADDKKVETLVQVYSNMKPNQAAKIFESMDEDLAVEILGRMKKKNAAEVMNLIKAEKAQVITEKYAGYKRKPAAANTAVPDSTKNN